MRGPRFHFSLRSPYSWLAYDELSRRHPELLDRLEWVPYWEPDARGAAELAAAGGEFLYSAMSKAKNLYILRDVKRLAAERGLVPTWPVDRDPHWEVPHLAYLAAADAGRGHGFIQAVHRARWGLGRDICDPEVIAGVLRALGLSPVDIEDDGLRARGVAALLDGCRAGVFGVPFMVNRRQRFWGLDRLSAFVDSLGVERVPEPVAERTPEVDLAGEGGHAGGCG